MVVLTSTGEYYTETSKPGKLGHNNHTPTHSYPPPTSHPLAHTYAHAHTCAHKPTHTHAHTHTHTHAHTPQAHHSRTHTYTHMNRRHATLHTHTHTHMHAHTHAHTCTQLLTKHVVSIACIDYYSTIAFPLSLLPSFPPSLLPSFTAVQEHFPQEQLCQAGYVLGLYRGLQGRAVSVPMCDYNVNVAHMAHMAKAML